MESIREAQLVITLMVYLKEGKENLFLQYEEEALPFLDKYNGKLEYRIRPHNSCHVIDVNPKPYEIHILSFKKMKDFHNFSKDQDRLLLADMYHESVEVTMMIQGQAF